MLLTGLGILGIASWLFLFNRADLVMVSPLRNCNPWQGVTEDGTDTPPATTGSAQSRSSIDDASNQAHCTLDAGLATLERVALCDRPRPCLHRTLRCSLAR